MKALTGNDQALIKLDVARKALAAAKNIPDVKKLHDQARTAVEYYKRRREYSHESAADAAELAIRAERRLGELLAAEGDRRGALAEKGRKSQGGTSLPLPEGISRSQSHRWQLVATVPTKDFEAHVESVREKQETVTTTGLVRLAKEQGREKRRDVNREKVQNATDPTLGGAKFATIVVDPPWDWGDEGDADQLGRARPTYATKTLDEIRAHPIGELSDVDCHLYLWITNRSLPKGFDLLTSWGFRYITCLTWCKPSIGMGNYFRGSTEHVLFGVNGSQELKRKDVGTWFQAPRGNQHSAKPNEFYTLVESCSPGPYLDVFGRTTRDGWTVWGEDSVAELK